MDDATASIGLVISVIGDFGLAEVAKKLGISSTEITRTASAFQI